MRLKMKAREKMKQALQSESSEASIVLHEGE